MVTGRKTVQLSESMENAKGNEMIQFQKQNRWIGANRWLDVADITWAGINHP